MSKLIIKNRYATVPNCLLENKEISLRAKGIYAYIQSRPDNWDFSIEKLAHCTGETLYKVKYALQELSKHGFLHRIKFTKGKGHFDIDYILYDQPNLSSDGVSTDDISSHDISSDDTPTDIYKKDESKKEENKKEERKSLQLSPSNSFSNSEIIGKTKEVSDKPSPSNTPLPPDVKNLGVKMFDLLRSKMRAEMDDILSRTELDLPTLSEMFAEYWIYNKGREFDAKNWKGVVSSFQKWFEVGGNKELPKKELSAGINARGVMEDIIEYVQKKKKIEISNDEIVELKKFLANTILTDEQLKIDVTKRFVNGNASTWKYWLRIAQEVQSEETYHRRLNSKL